MILWEFIVDNVAPYHWRDFSPTDWVADQTPDCTIRAADNTAGLDVSTAYYEYSTDVAHRGAAGDLQAAPEATAPPHIRR